MRRRDFLALPAAAAAPFRGWAGAPTVEVLRLRSEHPFAELAGHWRARGLPDPVRIVARCEPGWWPSRTDLPDGWRAWLELPGGSAVVVERRPGAAAAPQRVPAHCRAARALAAALSAVGSAAA